MPTRPVRIAVLNDYEIVSAGVAAALKPFGDQVEVVELDAGLPAVSDVDIVLYDTFSAPQANRLEFEPMMRGSRAKIVVFSWNLQPELVQQALDRGAAGYLPKSMTGQEIADALVRIHAGEVVRPASAKPALATEDLADAATWPGREFGLTARESEVIALITQGLSNQEIAEKSYLSINSVKTYIRTAYRKMGVTRRAQAVAWGIEHGFQPDRTRSFDV